MNRRKIIFISVGMGLAMIGLVVMQLLWLRSAMQIKEAAFNESIQRIFTHILDDIDHLEKLSTKNSVLKMLGQSPIIPREKVVLRGGSANSQFIYKKKK